MEQTEALLAELASQRQGVGRPYVTISYAQSLDGSITAQRGRPLALSGPQSLVLTHKLRAAHDAILVGIGTVLADNPRLTVRLVDGHNPQPVVIDSRLRFPPDANLLQAHPLHIWIATSHQADQARQAVLERAGARILRLPSRPDGLVDLAALLEGLAALGVQRLMVEGGARLITNLLRERLADLLVLTISPRFVGGLRAVDNLDGSEPGCLPHVRRPSYERLGDDVVVWGELTWEST